jgi:tRNA pseudouridine32 synthase/23S rRNA pseudouridine746 synthase
MQPDPGGIAVVYADESLLVLNKPSGLLCVPGRGEDKQDCLSTRVQKQFPEALIVHRLDMATSGLLVMARSPDVQKTLNQAFAAREVGKRYIAVVEGIAPVSDEWQTIDLPILVDWPKRPLRKIDPLNGKASTTRWRCMGVDLLTSTSRLELEPLTGRSHQLRVHLQSIGHPILGDALYSPPHVVAASARLLLHAAELGLRHPMGGDSMHWTCDAGF